MIPTSVEAFAVIATNVNWMHEYTKRKPVIRFGPPQSFVNRHRRVGKTGPERLRWAVEFAQRDLNGLMPGEWTDLLSGLRAFIAFPFPIGEEQPPRFMYVKGKASLTKDEAKEVQRAYQRFIAELVNKRKASTEELRVTVSAFIVPHPYHLDRTLLGVTHYAKDLVSEAMWSLLGLLAAHGLLLRECPEMTCRRVFVAARRNQSYCSTLCLSRRKTREYRKRKGAGKR